MQNDATQKFVRIGDGKCKMRVWWCSRDRVNSEFEDLDGTIWYMRLESIIRVAKIVKGDSIRYTFDFSSSVEPKPYRIIEAIACSKVSSEYDKYITEVILEEKAAPVDLEQSLASTN